MLVKTGVKTAFLKDNFVCPVGILYRQRVGPFYKSTQLFNLMGECYIIAPDRQHQDVAMLCFLMRSCRVGRLMASSLAAWLTLLPDISRALRTQLRSA